MTVKQLLEAIKLNLTEIEALVAQLPPRQDLVEIDTRIQAVAGTLRAWIEENAG